MDRDVVEAGLNRPPETRTAQVRTLLPSLHAIARSSTTKPASRCHEDQR
ncbi:hypothetical protein GA0115256_12582 [Streptomyces sp. DconLS]|nr:hypothetical protein GA0115256_12582 [Streptomyces sp. DconLS]